MAECFLGGTPKGRPKDAVRRPGKQEPDTPEGGRRSRGATQRGPERTSREVAAAGGRSGGRATREDRAGFGCPGSSRTWSRSLGASLPAGRSTVAVWAFALDHELQLVAGGVGAIALSSAVRAESRISRDPTTGCRSRRSGATRRPQEEQTWAIRMASARSKGACGTATSSSTQHRSQVKTTRAVTHPVSRLLPRARAPRVGRRHIPGASTATSAVLSRWAAPPTPAAAAFPSPGR